MNKNEKKIVSIIALVLVVCIAGVTAVSFLYEPKGRGDKKHRTTVSQTVTDAVTAAPDKQESTGSASADSSAANTNSTAADSQSSKKNENNTASSANQNFAFSLEDAKAIALKDSGKDESAVTFKKQKLDRDNGIYEYEIEFHDGVTEYEYDINAQTGEIISRSSEPFDYD